MRDSDSGLTPPTRRTVLAGTALGVLGLTAPVAGQDGGDDGTTTDDGNGGPTTDDGEEDDGTTTDGGTARGGEDRPCFGLTSSAFAFGDRIPTQYTCDGENVSPPLAIQGVLDGAAALALLMDDPDAPREVPFTHWLLWNAPPETLAIPERVPKTETLDSLGGARQGTNDAGNVGYAGPCPPSGTHTYRFRLYALDSPLDLAPGADRAAFLDAVAAPALELALLTGVYSRGG